MRLLIHINVNVNMSASIHLPPRTIHFHYALNNVARERILLWINLVL